MADFLINLVNDYGYLGMFLGMVLEAIIIIIPSEFILATAGILVSKHLFTFGGAFVTGILGSLFCEYGMLSALIGRNIPIVRTLISLPIGIMRLSFFKFVIYTTIGSIPWTFLFIYLGLHLGNNWIEVNNYIDLLKIPIRILLIYFIYRFIKKKKRLFN